MAADSAELWSAKGFGVYTGVNAGTVSNSFEPELGLEGGNDGREKERERVMDERKSVRGGVWRW